MIVFNFAGLVMLLVGFGAAYGLGLIAGRPSEDVLMVTSGPLLLAADLGYRFVRKAGQSKWWLRPGVGGQLFYAPIWMWGIFWMALGLYRLAA
jgi:hypothetical protein